jgi:hypothetical protein
VLTSVASEAHVELRFADALFKKSDNSYQICFMAVLKTLDVESLDSVGYFAFGVAGHISQPIDNHIDRRAVASADAIAMGRRLIVAGSDQAHVMMPGCRPGSAPKVRQVDQQVMAEWR